jgi:serine protease Do
MRRLGHLAVAIAIAAALPAAAHADDSAPPGNGAAPPQAVVYCYEAARGIVSLVLLGECHGKIVSEAEAAAIRDKRENQIKNALTHRAPRSHDGLHMVSLGTGFYTDDSGRLLTNDHVVEGCTVVTVRAGIDDEIPADVLAIDRMLDLALLKADTQTGATAEFPALGAILSDTSVAIVGYPTQGLAPLEPLATPGMVMRNTVNIGGSDHLVMHADLRHGNSGGPILDRLGRVIGMVNAKLDSPAYYSATGLNVTDVGFGIPGRTVVDFLTRNNASHEESYGGEALTLDEILKRARAFVVRTECWK